MSSISMHLQSKQHRSLKWFMEKIKSSTSLKVDHFHHILLGGDQLTIARVQGCQRIRNNSENGRACLEGFFPVVEDWHTKMCYMKVSYPLILYIHTHNYSIMVCPQKIVSVSTGMHVTTSVLLDSPHFHIKDTNCQCAVVHVYIYTE